MRLRRLELAAFGSFTDRVLDLSGGAPGGLHLIFGRNAAGKSTALRAIGDLLFGIPVKTEDSHLHPNASLRIRAELEDGQGRRILVQRLKRNKDSLRDENDAPLAETALTNLLGAVDRKMFESVFGLDHERLRAAGQSLVEGNGDVGESLFDASAGGHGVRAILQRLEQECDELFKASGRRPRLNELIEQYKTTRKQVRDEQNVPEAYAEQNAEVDKLGERRVGIQNALRELREEDARTNTLLQALKTVAKRAQLLSELEALGPVPEISESLVARRELLQGAIKEQSVCRVGLERDLHRLSALRDQLRIPEALLKVGEAAMHAIRDGIGSTRKARADLPDREAELGELRARARALAERSGLSDESELGADKPTAAAESRLRKLVSDRVVLFERRRALGERSRDVRARLDAARARLAALPAEASTDVIEATLVLLEESRKVDAELALARRELAEKEARAIADQASLKPYTGSVSELVRLGAPSEETILRFERDMSLLADAVRQLAEEHERRHARALVLTQEISAEEISGKVPSELELDQSRTLRDQALERVFSGIKERPESGLDPVTVAEHRDKVTQADQIADRLRREASRVAQRARREAELESLTQERARLAELEAKQREQEQRTRKEWISVWEGLVAEPLSPPEMRSFIVQRGRAVDAWIALENQRARVSGLEERARGLGLELGRRGVEVPLAVEKKLRAELETLRAAGADRRALGLQIAELVTELEHTEQEAVEQQEREQRWQASFAAALTNMGLDPELEPEAIEGVLEGRRELAQALRQAAELDRRIVGMRRDLASFESEVGRLVQAHDPDLASTSADAAASELLARFDRGKRDADTQSALLPEMAERERELSECRAALGAATTEFEELMAGVSARDLGEFLALEGRARRARELRTALDAVTTSLMAAAGTRGLDALLKEASETDAARLSTRLGELELGIQGLEDELSATLQRIASLEKGLERFAGTGAVDGIQKEEELVAAIAHGAERWARLKIAKVLLEREIELHRERDQGPVLRQASEIFRRLTSDAYIGLRVGREETEIVALRSDEREVKVTGLNEAARYDLYLALRIASLERYWERAEPLPVVLDDVLIDFDEQSAKSVLSVLGDVARKVQLLVFTHHHHNLALAARTVPEDLLFIHEL